MATQIGSLFASIGLQTDALSRDITKATGMFSKFAGKLETLGKDISLKLTAPMAAFGAVSVKSFADFEKGMANVQTIANASKAQFKDLEDGVRSLSKRLGLDLNDSVNGLYETLSANVPKENALSFLEVAAKAGKAGVSSTKTAVDGLTSALNSYKIPAEKAGEISDKFFIAIRNGKTNFEQLASSIGQVAPTAAGFGVSLDEVLASVASLTKQGVQTSTAMTQLKASMTAIAKPNEKMTQLLNSLGFESGSAMLSSLGLVNSLEALRMAAGDLDTLTGALGSTDALGATMALTGENAKGFAADLRDVKDSAGATDKAVSEFTGTAKDNWGKLNAALTDLQVTVGEKLVPLLKPFVEQLTQWVNKFGQLDSETQTLIVQTGAFLALLGPALVIIAKVGTAVATLVGWFGGLSKIWGTVTVVGANLATVFGYIFSALTALPVVITTVGLGLGYLWSHMEFFQLAGNGLVDVVYLAYEAIKAFGEGLINFLQAPIATAMGWIDGLMRSFLTLIGVIDSADDRLRRAQEGEGSIARARRLGLTGLANSMEDDLRRGLPGRANGGPVQPGTAYLVGEHGPELFSPRVSGGITPLTGSSAPSSGAAPTIHIHLTAGVPEAVRAEVSALVPRLSRTIAEQLAAARQRPGSLGRALA